MKSIEQYMAFLNDIESMSEEELDEYDSRMRDKPVKSKLEEEDVEIIKENILKDDEYCCDAIKIVNENGHSEYYLRIKPNDENDRNNKYVQIHHYHPVIDRESDLKKSCQKLYNNWLFIIKNNHS